jgi:hypothetical protein
MLRRQSNTRIEESRYSWIDRPAEKNTIAAPVRLESAECGGRAHELQLSPLRRDAARVRHERAIGKGVSAYLEYGMTLRTL